MKAHLKYHEVGQYAFMRADMSPRVLQQLGDTLRRDTDVIRLNIVKMADQTIKEVSDARAPPTRPYAYDPVYPPSSSHPTPPNTHECYTASTCMASTDLHVPPPPCQGSGQ